MNWDFQVVLITGGTGTFGRAFARYLLTTNVVKIIIFSRDELKQSEMMQDPDLQDERLRYFIGDVRDKERLHRAFVNVDTVIHAAAMKQIDAATYNPAEAVKTNVLGTMNVIEAAIDCYVERVLALSSDKDCEATTLYGKTKAVVEGLITGAGVYSNRTIFACCRYGNVFGSRGSIAQRFKDMKIKKGTKLPLTHKDASRFHMRLEQAVKFVDMALGEMDGGEIFIPKLPSYWVSDLIRAFGYGHHIIGLRPAEKIHEVMVSSEESRSVVDKGDYLVLAARNADDSRPQFWYASGNNTRMLTVKQLKEEIACLP